MSTSSLSSATLAALAPAPALAKEGVAKPVSEANLMFQAQITAAYRLLRATAALSASNSSNISVRIPGTERFVIAGPNIATDFSVGESSAAVVDAIGNHYEGRIGPGIQEVISVHGAVYRLRPDVGAVIHTHSTNLTSLAIAHQDLPVAFPPLLEWNVIPVLPTTVWAPRYAPTPVEETLARHPRAAGVLLGNRGTLLFGSDALDAARHTVYLEEAAGIVIDAAVLGGVKPLPAAAFPA
jgi:L-fuculose-phosphate aldolase